MAFPYIKFFLLSQSVAAACKGTAEECQADASFMLQLPATKTEPASHGRKTPIHVCAIQSNRCSDMEVQRLEVTEEHEQTLRSTQLVVARYDEDVSWLDALPSVQSLIYNRGGSKGNLPSPRNNLHVVPQENIGREDQVWVQHILDNYNGGLADLTIFLQGWPFLHCESPALGIKSALEMMTSQSNGQFPGIIPMSDTFYKYSVVDGKVGWELNAGEGDSTARVLFKEMCDAVLGLPCPEKLWVAEGGQWAVSRARILSRPKAFYENILKIGESYHKKLRGLVLEALWPVIWDDNMADNMAAAYLWQPLKSRSLGLNQLTRNAAASKPSDALDFRDVVEEEHRSESYCSARNSNHELRWSCQDRSGFCDLSRELTEASFSKTSSSMFSKTSSSMSGVMFVELAMALLPGSSFKVVVENGGLSFRRSDRGGRPAVWQLTRVAAHSFSFRLSGKFGEQASQYLGCDSKRGIATLTRKATAWNLTIAPDARWLVRTSNQNGLRIAAKELGKPPDNLSVLCAPAGDDLEIEPWEVQMNIDRVDALRGSSSRKLIFTGPMKTGTTSFAHILERLDSLVDTSFPWVQHAEWNIDGHRQPPYDHYTQSCGCTAMNCSTCEEFLSWAESKAIPFPLDEGIWYCHDKGGADWNARVDFLMGDKALKIATVRNPLERSQSLFYQFNALAASRNLTERTSALLDHLHATKDAQTTFLQRTSESKSAGAVAAQYDMLIPLERLEEAVFVLGHHLGLTMPEIVQVWAAEAANVASEKSKDAGSDQGVFKTVFEDEPSIVQAQEAQFTLQNAEDYELWGIANSQFQAFKDGIPDFDQLKEEFLRATSSLEKMVIPKTCPPPSYYDKLQTHISLATTPLRRSSAISDVSTAVANSQKSSLD